MNVHTRSWKHSIQLPTLTIGVGSVAASLAILSIVVYATNQDEEYRKILGFTATALATTGGITGAVYVAQSLESDAESKVIDRTLSYITRWNSPDFQRKSVTQLLRKSKSKSDNEKLEFIKRQLDSDEALWQEFIFVLNFFEEMATSVHQGIVKDSMLKEFFRSIVCTYIQVFGCWINYRRGIKGDKAFIHIEELCEEWNGMNS